MRTEAKFDKSRGAGYLNNFADAMLLWYLIVVAEARPKKDRRREAR